MNGSQTEIEASQRTRKSSFLPRPIRQWASCDVRERSPYCGVKRFGGTGDILRRAGVKGKNNFRERETRSEQGGLHL